MMMADDGVRQPPMVGKWRTSGTQSLVSRRIPARYAALCIPGYGRVPSLCDERVQTGGCVDIYNRSSAVDVNGLMSRGRRANPVLTCETALRRFFALRRWRNQMMMAVDVNASISRGRQANPVLTCETALRRFFPHCAVEAIRWVMATAVGWRL